MSLRFTSSLLSPPVLPPEEDGDPPVRVLHPFAEFLWRIERHPHRVADRFAHGPGSGDDNITPRKNILDRAGLGSREDVLRVGSPGLCLVPQRAGIDEHEAGEPEIFHHAGTEPHVPLVDWGHQHDVDLGHKKITG